MIEVEILKQLALKLKGDIPEHASYEKAILDITRLPGVVQFKDYLIDHLGDKIQLEVSFGYTEAKAVLELYEITQTKAPVHADWNRAELVLFADGKFEITYELDTGLNSEIDMLNEV